MEQWKMGEQGEFAARLGAAAARGTLSHALLLIGEDPVPAARYAAAAMQCTHDSDRPCGVCTPCRKVLGDIHPDVMTVRDEEHAKIGVDVVRAVRADAYIRPNEGRRKVYIFPDCSLLSEPDQNVLLKLVEEGPPYAAFIFCARNASSVLKTLRSRCTEWRLRPADAQKEDEAAAEFCRVLAGRKRGDVLAFAVRTEKSGIKREALTALLGRSREILVEALEAHYGCTGGSDAAATLAKNLTKEQIVRTIEVLQKYHSQCAAYYVGPGHVLGALAAELEGIL